jgi:hypothetical protein
MWFRWVGEFEDTEEGQEFKFKSGKCGCWVRHPPTECKLVKSQMLDFLKKNGKKKGQANMTLENIRDELNSNILPSVANEYGLKMMRRGAPSCGHSRPCSTQGARLLRGGWRGAIVIAATTTTTDINFMPGGVADFGGATSTPSSGTSRCVPG